MKYDPPRVFTKDGSRLTISDASHDWVFKWLGLSGWYELPPELTAPEAKGEEWPKAYQWHNDEQDVIVLRSESDTVECAMGFAWNYAKVQKENLEALSTDEKEYWIEVTPPDREIAAAAELTTLRAKLAATESERDYAAALVTKHGQENIRLRAELVAALKRVAELENEMGLMAEPRIRDAVKSHIEERYKSIKPDSCFSAVHKVYQTGDALCGPSVVVEWDDVCVWFSPDGNAVEMSEYPSSNAKLRQEIAALRDASPVNAAVLNLIEQAQYAVNASRVGISTIGQIEAALQRLKTETSMTKHYGRESNSVERVSDAPVAELEGQLGEVRG